MYAGEIVETGFVKDVMVNPSHPYTKALLKSFPSLKGQMQRWNPYPAFYLILLRITRIVYSLRAVPRPGKDVLEKNPR